MTKAADDYESIARHLKELEAERQLALTGSSAPVTEKVGEYATGWPYTAATDYDWSGWPKNEYMACSATFAASLEAFIDSGLIKPCAPLRYVGEELPKPEYEWQVY